MTIGLVIAIIGAFFAAALPGIGSAYGVQIGGQAGEIADVGQQAAERDADEQQRLEALDNAQIEQNAGNDDHDEVSPTTVHDQACKAGFHRQLIERIAHTEGSGSSSQKSHSAPPYARTTRAAPVSTTAPLETTTCATEPSRGAMISFSIFMASSTTSTSPALTAWP